MVALTAMIPPIATSPRLTRPTTKTPARTVTIRLLRGLRRATRPTWRSATMRVASRRPTREGRTGILSNDDIDRWWMPTRHGPDRPPVWPGWSLVSAAAPPQRAAGTAADACRPDERR